MTSKIECHACSLAFGPDEIAKCDGCGNSFCDDCQSYGSMVGDRFDKFLCKECCESIRNLKPERKKQ